jgi:two-component system, cell cycle sensor histidine kinase and response regulator CckA
VKHSFHGVKKIMNVPQKILVLDNVLENDQVLSDALKGNGYEVITTDKNKDFDEILESHNPDLILLNTMMSAKVKTILEQKLALQKELQKSQKMASITALTGGIAHNINNLMGAIVGYSDLLRNNISDNKKSIDFAERILEASQRVTELTTDLLTYSRSIRNTPTSVKTKSLIDDMLFLYGDNGEKKVNIELKIPEDIPEVYVDIEQICRALGIIFVKAKEATPEKSKVTITADIDKIPLRSRRSEPEFEEYVVISIEDTGNGIDEDTARKLSDSFFTINHAVESELELSAASSIIRKNKGFIHIDTKPNIGSKFHIYLPKIALAE